MINLWVIIGILGLLIPVFTFSIYVIVELHKNKENKVLVARDTSNVFLSTLINLKLITLAYDYNYRINIYIIE